MNLSIGIVHFHAEDYLKRFLASIFSNPPQGLFEIIVADNGSFVDKLDGLRQEFPDVQWVRMEKNLGFGAALNHAMREAKGDYILLANPDLVAQMGSIQHLMDFLKMHPKAGIVGPKLVFENGQVQDSARRLPTIFDLVKHRLGFKPRKYLFLDQDKTVPFQCSWLVGAALLMRRDLFLQRGGFDERFFLFFEDTDLCQRVKNAGYEVWYCPDSVFTHTEKRLSESHWPLGWLFKKTFWIHVVSAIRYYKKWCF